MESAATPKVNNHYRMKLSEDNDIGIKETDFYFNHFGTGRDLDYLHMVNSLVVDTLVRL